MEDAEEGGGGLGWGSATRQRGLEAGAQGQAGGQSRELREPRVDRVSLLAVSVPGPR